MISERARDVAIVHVDSSLVAARPALPLACPPSRSPSLDDGQAITSMMAPHDREKELTYGDVTALQPRRVETDMRLPFGGSGGPVFNDSGAIVGLSKAIDPEDDTVVIPTVFICEALAASVPAMSGTAPVAATRLPVDPTRPYPRSALEDAPEKNVIRAGLYVFDPGAFGPQCGTVTLSFSSEAQPERVDMLTLSRTVIDQIWNDFAPYRATSR